MDSKQLTLQRRLLIVLMAFCPTLDQSALQGHADFYPRILSLHAYVQSPCTCSATVPLTNHTRYTQIFTCIKERLTQQQDTPLLSAYRQVFPLLLSLLPSPTFCLHSDLCTAEVCLKQGSSRQSTALPRPRYT